MLFQLSYKGKLFVPLTFTGPFPAAVQPTPRRGGRVVAYEDTGAIRSASFRGQVYAGRTCNRFSVEIWINLLSEFETVATTLILLPAVCSGSFIS
jgi:hypothetical protein